MVIEVPVQRPMLYQQTAEGEAGVGEYSEQVLRLMHSLGIDQHKTVEVRNYTNFKKLNCTLNVHTGLINVALF